MADATDFFANANLSNLNELVFVVTNGFNLSELVSADADVADATDFLANANLSNLNELMFVVTNGFNLSELVSANADVADATDFATANISNLN